MKSTVQKFLSFSCVPSSLMQVAVVFSLKSFPRYPGSTFYNVLGMPEYVYMCTYVYLSCVFWTKFWVNFIILVYDHSFNLSKTLNLLILFRDVGETVHKQFQNLLLNVLLVLGNEKDVIRTEVQQAGIFSKVVKWTKQVDLSWIFRNVKCQRLLEKRWTLIGIFWMGGKKYKVSHELI